MAFFAGTGNPSCVFFVDLLLFVGWHSALSLFILSDMWNIATKAFKELRQENNS